jgi:hypothetical protein
VTLVPPVVVVTAVLPVVAGAPPVPFEPAVPPPPAPVVAVVPYFTHRDERQTSPVSHAPPLVQAHPSAPTMHDVPPVEDEHAIHKNPSASAPMPPKKSRFAPIVSS